MDRKNSSNSSNSTGSALRKVDSYQYPRTHVGHISNKQEQSLAAFESLAAEKGYYHPPSGDEPASHDDETMLRYLRARKFIPEEAFKQFKDTEDWRRDNKIDALYESIDVDEYEASRKMYPQWTGRRDKRGIPLYTFEVAHLTSKRMAEYEKTIHKSKTVGKTSPKLLNLFALYENLTRFAFPLCSGIDRPYPETPVSQSNNLVDIAGVSLKQFWNLRQHMQDASQLATAHYPETLDRIFVVGAPSFFPTVWAWIKGWFDPITVSKIFILSKANMESTLKQYIDPANIPIKYGGTLEWQWGELPSLEPEIAQALEWVKPSKNDKGENMFPPGPIKWQLEENGSLSALAVGSIKGKRREELVARIPMPKSDHLVPAGSGASFDGDLFGPASTSGVHTHPSAEQQYFPSSGVTPPEYAEHDDKSLAKALGPENENNRSTVGSDAPTMSPATDIAAVGAVGAGLAGVAAVNASLPSPRDATDMSLQEQQFPHAEEEDLPIRTGTSNARYEQQATTAADGQLQEGTPSVRDHGHGDKTQTIEPSTVAQGQKNVDVPLAKDEQEQAPAQPSYVEQARNAAAGAVGAVSAVGSGVLAKVGLGGSGEEAKQAEAEGEKEEEKKEEETPDDPRIDKLDNADVEDFIRSKYTSSNRPIEQQ